MPFELSTTYVRYLIEHYLIPFGLRVITALLVFFVGRLVVRALMRVFERAARGRLDESLSKFLSSILYALLLAVVIIAALDRLGVRTTAAVAIIGAAGLAVGLALQGSLSNFAAGVMILLFRPYRVGDTITVGAFTGTVSAIEIFHTILITADNQKIIIPNGQIMAGAIVNLTAQGTRRIELEVSVEGADLQHTRERLEEALRADARILAEPAPEIAVSKIGGNSTVFTVRPWVRASDYAAVRGDAIARIRAAVDAPGVTIS